MLGDSEALTFCPSRRVSIWWCEERIYLQFVMQPNSVISICPPRKILFGLGNEATFINFLCSNADSMRIRDNEFDGKGYEWAKII